MSEGGIICCSWMVSCFFLPITFSVRRFAPSLYPCILVLTAVALMYLVEVSQRESHIGLAVDIRISAHPDVFSGQWIFPHPDATAVASVRHPSGHHWWHRALQRSFCHSHTGPPQPIFDERLCSCLANQLLISACIRRTALSAVVLLD